MIISVLLSIVRTMTAPLYSVAATILYSRLRVGSQALAMIMNASNPVFINLIFSAGGVSSTQSRSELIKYITYYETHEACFPEDC